MKESRPVSPVSATTKVLTATAIAIAVILLGSNFTVISAQQQQQQQLTTGSGEIENTTTAGAATLFQSTDDSFSIQVPGGWIAHDINNTGSASSEETRLGYGLLAQLCSQEEQGAGAVSPDAASAANNTTSSSNSCQGAQEEVVHIIRYPDLDTRIQPTSNLTQYHLQKLTDVGYRNMQIIATRDVIVNLTNPLTNETLQTSQGQFADMTYTTTMSPNETKTGHYILTSTNNTAPNATATKGYAVFYEGNSGGVNTPEAAITPTTASSLPISTQVGQILGSFELIAAPGVAETLEQPTAQPAEFTEDTTEEEVEEEEAEDDEEEDGGNGDDDGGNGDDDGGNGDDDGGNGDDDGGNGDDDGGNGDDDGGNGDDDGGNGDDDGGNGDDDGGNGDGGLTDCIIQGNGNCFDDYG